MALTDTLLMIRPASFRMNEETSVNNYYQRKSAGTDREVLLAAQNEFDALVSAVRDKGIDVCVVEDREEENTPDALFPNNWISFHSDGSIVLYPMFAKNRQREVRRDIVADFQSMGFDSTIDLTPYAANGTFLEGTGSIVLDRANNVAYCARSPRADETLLKEFCATQGLEPVVFNSYQTVNGQRELIYHTNVMMSVGEKVAVVCLASIDDLQERSAVTEKLRATQKEIVEISEEQVSQFAGNILQVTNVQGDVFFVMSDSARNAFTASQREVLLRHGEIISSDLSTIETNGGGSARCMLAEVFAPKKN